MIEIRKPEEPDRQRVVDLMCVAFNAPPAWVRHIAPAMRLDRFLCAYENGRMIAMTQVYDMTQWFGGRPMTMAGIAAVATVPDRRGGGVTPQLLRAALANARASGAVLSTLYPSRAAFYRRMGYEYAGALTQYRVSLADLPAPSGVAAEDFAGDDLEPIRSCYRAFAERQNGHIECVDDDFWRQRVLRRWNPDVPGRAVVVRGEAGFDGYATYQLEALPDTWGFRISCLHFVGRSEGALRSLLSYFQNFRGIGQTLSWWGPPNEPLGLLLGGGGETLQPSRTVRFMTRILDVARALEARGYLLMEASATFSVQDDLFEENCGAFRIEVHEGRARVARSGASGVTPIPIGALSTLFAGYLMGDDLVRVGVLRAGDPSAELLTRLFAGTPPWMMDFF